MGVGVPFLAWLLSVYGLTLIVTESKLLGPLRRILRSRSAFLGDLVHCPMCFGFWAGLGLALLGVSLYPGGVLSILCSAFAGSAVGWIFRLVTHRLGADDL